MHSIDKINLKKSVHEASDFLSVLQRLQSAESIKHGLILTPNHEDPEDHSFESNGIRVNGISMGGSGNSLNFGLNAIARFVRSDIY